MVSLKSTGFLAESGGCIIICLKTCSFSFPFPFLSLFFSFSFLFLSFICPLPCVSICFALISLSLPFLFHFPFSFIFLSLSFSFPFPLPFPFPYFPFLFLSFSFKPESKSIIDASTWRNQHSWLMTYQEISLLFIVKLWIQNGASLFGKVPSLTSVFCMFMHFLKANVQPIHILVSATFDGRLYRDMG